MLSLFFEKKISETLIVNEVEQQPKSKNNSHCKQTALTKQIYWQVDIGYQTCRLRRRRALREMDRKVDLKVGLPFLKNHGHFCKHYAPMAWRSSLQMLKDC